MLCVGVGGNILVGCQRSRWWIHHSKKMKQQGHECGREWSTNRKTATSWLEIGWGEVVNSVRLGICLSNSGGWHNIAQEPDVFVNKVLSEHNPIWLSIVYSFFCTMTAQLKPYGSKGKKVCHPKFPEKLTDS